MYYKIIYEHIVIDIIDKPRWVAWSKNSFIFILTDETSASGIVASSGNDVYHIDGKPEFVGREEPTKTVRVCQISEAEYNALNDQIYVEKVGEDGNRANLEQMIETKIKEMSVACESAITNGFDIILSDGALHHFSLQLSDQVKISKLNDRAVAGELFLPYHADNEPCKIFSADDIIAINQKMEHTVEYQVTYFNSLKMYIRGMTNIDDVINVKYGDEIPDGYQSDVMKLFVQQLTSGVEQ